MSRVIPTGRGRCIHAVDLTDGRTWYRTYGESKPVDAWFLAKRLPEDETVFCDRCGTKDSHRCAELREWALDAPRGFNVCTECKMEMDARAVRVVSSMIGQLRAEREAPDPEPPSPPSDPQPVDKAWLEGIGRISSNEWRGRRTT